VKVLILSTNELEGGAARAAYRLHQGLLEQGTDSHMLVQSRSTEHPRVHAPQAKINRGLSAIRPTLDQLPMALFAPAGRQGFAAQWFPDQLAGRVKRLQPDILNLHWVCKGFLKIETLSHFSAPIVWTFHDMWAMTGGCFYAGDCAAFQQECGKCPKLESRRGNDLSRWVWRRKKRAWRDVAVTVVCPSRWMARQAAQSALFAGRRIEVIPNGLDLQRFRPFERSQARDMLGLPQNKHLLLFSAVRASHNPYKGFSLLPAIFERLSGIGALDQVELVVLGETDAQAVSSMPVHTHLLGHLHDEVSLALAYSAADVLLAPSLQDNFPNSVLEALACGTPVVAFNVGGIPEMVEHQADGYLVDAGDTASFAAGVRWILEDAGRRAVLSGQARQRAVAQFDQSIQVRRYLELYAQLLGSSGLPG
jgi:glycosyltransferase involved in cell wall biosynthesis